jgi:hypothetical protein
LDYNRPVITYASGKWVIREFMEGKLLITERNVIRRTVEQRAEGRGQRRHMEN